MSESAASKPDSLAHLLRKLHDVQAENRRLKRRARWLRESRDRWRNEAKLWKWGAIG